MKNQTKKQPIYILSPEDADRIDHLIGVLSTAITELFVAKRVHIPIAPEWLPAEEQLMDEKNELSGEAVRSGAYDF